MPKIIFQKCMYVGVCGMNILLMVKVLDKYVSISFFLLLPVNVFNCSKSVVVYDAIMSLRTALDNLALNVKGLTSDEKGIVK